MNRSCRLVAIFFLPLFALPYSLTRADDKSPASTAQSSEATPVGIKKKWKPLVGHWKECQFGGEGPVEINEGEIKEGAITKQLIKVEIGDPLTAVHWGKEIEFRDNYELKLQARRTEGFDFFCGLTFPIAKDHVTLVLAGWGGGITGISSIDGLDASENETTMFQNYENDTWYEVRVRVDPFGIQCWIDDDLVVEVPRAGHKFGLRYEMEICEPVGIAAYQCKAEYRNILWRKLAEAELAEGKAKAKEWADDE